MIQGGLQQVSRVFQDHTSVSLEPLNGTWRAMLSRARMHSFNANKLLLISAPSIRVCLYEHMNSLLSIGCILWLLPHKQGYPPKEFLQWYCKTSKNWSSGTPRQQQRPDHCNSSGQTIDDQLKTLNIDLESAVSDFQKSTSVLPVWQEEVSERS